MLVRHHLVLPAEPALEQARRLVAADGYTVRAEPRGSAGPAGTEESSPIADPALEPAVADDLGWAVRVSRAQLVTGLSLAQERSRMAGLAQRLGGDAVGWDVLAPPPAGPDRQG
jgi:Regulator of ribonuclease activity B